MHWIMVLSHLVGSVLHLGQVVLEAVEEAVEAMSERDVVGGRDLVPVGLVLDVVGLVLLELEKAEMVATLNWAERARIQKVENFLES